MSNEAFNYRFIVAAVVLTLLGVAIVVLLWGYGANLDMLGRGHCLVANERFDLVFTSATGADSVAVVDNDGACMVESLDMRDVWYTPFGDAVDYADGQLMGGVWQQAEPLFDGRLGQLLAIWIRFFPLFTVLAGAVLIFRHLLMESFAGEDEGR